jgi:hypothetical protein
MIEPLNADFDGDTVALYIAHDKDSLLEMEKNAHIKNVTDFDNNNNKLSKLRHELIFAAYILTENYDRKYKEIKFKNFNDLDDLPENYEYLNNLDFGVSIKDKIYNYGVALFNKWAGFNDILINELITNKENNYISEVLFNYYKDSVLYYDKLTELNKKLFYFISSTNYTPSLDLDDMINLLDENTEILFKMLPDNNIPVGYLINEALLDRCLNKNFDKNSNFYKLYKSGSRFSKAQLSRIAINIGYVSDEKNIILTKPIKSNLLKGLTEDEFFRSSYGTRKGLVAKSDDTPKSGYLERTLTMALSVAEIIEDDCLDNSGLKIKVLNQKHAEILIHKYYKNELNQNWELITKDNFLNFINKEIYIRSPMTCKSKNFKICKKCFGEKKISTKYIGITAGQVLAERITQLTMRVFHESGAAKYDIDFNLCKYIEEYLIKISYNDTELILEFDNNDIPEEFKNILTFKSINNNKVIFDKDYNEDIINKDIAVILTTFQNLLKTNKKLDKNNQPVDYYLKFVDLMLSIGSLYSSYIEILLCNQFIVNKDNTEFWRYNQDKLAISKLGDKTLSRNLSPLLGILYEPNISSINLIDDIINDNYNSDNIYEKLYFGNFE